MPEKTTRYTMITLFLLLAAAVPCACYALVLTFGTSTPPVADLIVCVATTIFFLWLATQESHSIPAKIVTLLIGVPILMAAFLAPILAEDIRMRQENRPNCTANLKGIGNACHIYANDNNDIFPPDIETLLQLGHVTKDKLKCEHDKRENRLCSYDYISGLSLNDDVDFIVGYEDTAATSHYEEGGYVILFVDGHAKYHRNKEFEELMAYMKQKLAEQGKHLEPTDFGWRIVLIEPQTEHPIRTDVGQPQ